MAPQNANPLIRIDYQKIPAHMRTEVRRYIETGDGPYSDFLRAVFSDSLTLAYGRADSANREAIEDWADFLVNEAPVGCWGSDEAIENWDGLE